MADTEFNLTLRGISAIVLAFFLWTFGGMFEIAYAINSAEARKSGSPEVKGQTSNNKLQSGAGPQSVQNSRKSEAQSPEAQFEKTLEEMRLIIVDSKSDTNSKKSKLKEKKNKIDTLDLDIKKQFAATENKLKDAGLPEVILQRHHAFIKKYDDNLKELRTDLDNIDKAKNETDAKNEIDKTKRFLETVKPPKKQSKLDPNNLPHKVPEIKDPEVIERPVRSQFEGEEVTVIRSDLIQVAANGSLDGLLSGTRTATSVQSPTPGDLAETIETQLTPEIRAKAQELGNSPVKIYEYVRNGFEYEPYYGSLKGARQTLAEQAGNDFDQASLLIALLRAANIPARYVYGTIEMPIERILNWLGGVQDATTAGRLMATNLIPVGLINEGGTIKYAQFEHVWVEAYVDMLPSLGSLNKQGKSWTPLDPSMKEMRSSDSINLSKVVPFDETTYITSADKMPPVLSYIYKLKDFYNTNFDYDLSKIFYVPAKVKKEFGILMGTLPYKVISRQRYSEVPDSKRHKISFELSSDGINTIGMQKTLAETAGKKLTVSYSASTSADQSVITSYGGLLSTPAYLVSVKPEIKLDDVNIVTGPSMKLGGSLSITTTLSRPNAGNETQTTDISSGISYAIGVTALHYSGMQLVGQMDRMRVLEGTLHDSLNVMDSRAGELLQNLAIEYFGQLNNTSNSIAGIMHVRNTKMTSIAFVSAIADYHYLFDTPASNPVMKGLGINAIRVASSPMPIDGDSAQRKEFLRHYGLTSSYLEHKILENLFGVESVSAVKALQTAAKNGMPIYHVNSDNIDSILPTLTLNESDKSDIRNAISSGKIVTVSGNDITLGDWTGAGYIARDPNTGTGGYMISGLLSGGTQVKASNPAFNEEQKMAWLIVGDSLSRSVHGSLPAPLMSIPIETLKEWSALLTFDVDVAILALMPMWTHFGYISNIYILPGVGGKQLLLQAANHPFTWIFYYIGHGGQISTSDAEGTISTHDVLLPSFQCIWPSCEAETVYATDIHKGTFRNSPIDAKIVFLNASTSATNKSFESQFGIDRLHNGTTRAETFLGWSGAVNGLLASYVGLEFWLLMGMFVDPPMSITESINALKLTSLQYNLPTSLNNLYISVDGGVTTLVP